MNEKECKKSYNAIRQVLRRPEVGLVSLVESVEETIREGKMTFSEKKDSEIEIYQEREKLQLLLEAVEKTLSRKDMMEYIRKLDEIKANEIQQIRFRDPESNEELFFIQIYDQENGSNVEKQLENIDNLIRGLKQEINQSNMPN